MVKILVVDDDERITRLVRLGLARAGYEVEAVNDPEVALAAHRQGCYDLVISDVLMPRMDGHELTRCLALLSPASRVIHMSGFDPGCEECPYVRRCPFISKPFNVDEIVDFVGQVLTSPPPILKTVDDR